MPSLFLCQRSPKFRASQMLELSIRPLTPTEAEQIVKDAIRTKNCHPLIGKGWGIEAFRRLSGADLQPMDHRRYLAKTETVAGDLYLCAVVREDTTTQRGQHVPESDIDFVLWTVVCASESQTAGI